MERESKKRGAREELTSSDASDEDVTREEPDERTESKPTEKHEHDTWREERRASNSRVSQ